LFELVTLFYFEVVILNAVKDPRISPLLVLRRCLFPVVACFPSLLVSRRCLFHAVACFTSSLLFEVVILNAVKDPRIRRCLFYPLLPSRT
jgi:hypothetical protein